MMGLRAITTGPTSATVAANLTHFRSVRGITMAVMSERLSALGRPMAVNTLSSIEHNNRRVDVDDLMAFASALDISPSALLMPQVTVSALDDPDSEFEGEGRAVPTSAGAAPVPATALWRWITASGPLKLPDFSGQVDAFAVEMWRREQVPMFAWALRRKARPHANERG